LAPADRYAEFGEANLTMGRTALWRRSTYQGCRAAK